MIHTDQRDRLRSNPFNYHVTKAGKARLFYEGRHIMTLNEKDTEKLKRKMAGQNDLNVQLALAKVTGHFKH